MGHQRSADFKKIIWYRVKYNQLKCDHRTRSKNTIRLIFSKHESGPTSLKLGRVLNHPASISKTSVLSFNSPITQQKRSFNSLMIPKKTKVSTPNSLLCQKSTDTDLTNDKLAQSISSKWIYPSPVMNVKQKSEGRRKNLRKRRELPPIERNG